MKCKKIALKRGENYFIQAYANPFLLCGQIKRVSDPKEKPPGDFVFPRTP